MRGRFLFRRWFLLVADGRWPHTATQPLQDAPLLDHVSKWGSVCWLSYRPFPKVCQNGLLNTIFTNSMHSLWQMAKPWLRGGYCCWQGMSYPQKSKVIIFANSATKMTSYSSFKDTESDFKQHFSFVMLNYFRINQYEEPWLLVAWSCRLKYE